MNIQWYPGHMTKTRRMMNENLSLVDVVIELLDARIPYSSKNPDIDELAKNKYRVIVLNKADLAEEAATAVWSAYFKEKGFAVVLADSVKGRGIQEAAAAAAKLMEEKIARQKARGRVFVPIRAMVVGIPNVGKSTFINKTAGKTMAKTGDKPGVTRGKQWIKVKKDFELLDTPGILWPKFEDQEVGLKLAFCGAVNDDIVDQETLATALIALLQQKAPAALAGRYEVTVDGIPAHEVLREIAETRGFKSKGGEADTSRAAKILLDEYRGGKLGRLTLELPQDIERMNQRAAAEKAEKRQQDRERKRNFKQEN